MTTTTLAPVDRNQAFLAEKNAQRDQVTAANAQITERNANREADHAARVADFEAKVAAGEMRNLGGGRFEYLTGWDAGEVVTVRMNPEGQLLEVVAEHGLDMSTGQAALYTTTPQWHSLGNVVPGGLTDVDKIMDLGGINYEVVKRPVLFRNEVDGAARLMPEHFVNVRQDTGAGLGVVGSRYEVLQNASAFAFLYELLGTNEVVCESAGATREGRSVFICMRLPENITIDAEGINDQIVPFVAAINSHDGSSQAGMYVTPWRIGCSNTERFAVRDAITRWGTRHTKNVHDRVEEARKALRLTVQYYGEWKAEEESLARTELAMDTFRKVCEELWPAPEPGATQRSQTMYATRRTALETLYIDNAETLGRTAYAGERAITEYLDHHQTVRASKAFGNVKAGVIRATRIMDGIDDKTKTAAHKELMTLVRR